MGAAIFFGRHRIPARQDIGKRRVQAIAVGLYGAMARVPSTDIFQRQHELCR